MTTGIRMAAKPRRLRFAKKAATFLYIAFKELSSEGEVVLPFIAPANDGALVFEWHARKAES